MPSPSVRHQLSRAFTLLCLLSAWLVTGQALAYVECSNTTRSTSYQHKHRADEFVILYNLRGKNKLENPADENNNRTPDIVENIMLQLQTMRDVLSYLGFLHPFEQYRYDRVGVETIYVALRRQKGSGTAYDPSHRDISLSESAPCVLLISLSSELRTGNLTPAHELFHLYQYGYTVFKNDWYLEGMARWSESLLEPRQFPDREIPKSPAEGRALFEQSYSAASFWAAVAAEHSTRPVEIRALSNDLAERRYVNGELVIKPRASTRGAGVIVEVLEALGRLDREISLRTGRKAKSWNRGARDDPDNNEVILRTVLSVVAKRREVVEH